MNVRPAVEGDADALVRLVGGCYAEYPGCVLDLAGVDRDLLRPARAYDWFRVLEEEGDVVGCVGLAGHGPGTMELKRMYLAAGLRGSGRAVRLLALALEEAGARRARTIELWSDTRFTRAHRFYEREGFTRTGRTRRLFDPSDTTEYHFVLPLAGEHR